MSEFVKNKTHGIMKEIVKDYGKSELGGTLIPSATKLGGSMAFSVEDKLEPVVDPESPHSTAVGLSRVDIAGDDLSRRPVPQNDDHIEVKPADAVVVTESLVPTKRVCFDFGAPMGKIEAWYHSVFREGLLLVLVWDSRYKGGMKYTPADMPGHVIKLTIDNEELMVETFGINFSLTEQHLDLMVLIIKED